MAEFQYNDPDPVPVYILLIFAVLFCAYFTWLMSIAVRLYYYKGALNPEPERFVILPACLRDCSTQLSHQKRVTTFPTPLPPKSPARELARLSQAPRVNIAEMDTIDLPSPGLRAFLIEQQRISRLPAFVQDDCGNGSNFPDVPFATTPVDLKNTTTLVSPTLQTRPSARYKSVGLRKSTQNEWLHVDSTYKNMYAARNTLLTKQNSECVQVRADGQAACEELLQEIVKSSFHTPRELHRQDYQSAQARPQRDHQRGMVVGSSVRLSSARGVRKARDGRL